MAEVEVPTEVKTIEQPTTEVEQPQQPFKSFASQEDYDNETAKIRGVAERKAKAELLKTLGIDSEDKLEIIKKAYENSLTEQDKITEQLKQLGTLKAELDESKAIITVLSKLSNKPNDEVVKLVKMAKGLVGEGVTMEQALEEVLTLVKKEQPQQTKPPTSNVIATTPQGTVEMEQNPFKDGNMTEMGNLIRTNPEEARRLAKLAGFPVNF